ncbi:ATP-binding protein [Flavobacterium microcysteis]|uniref:histidine kinase n=1 Tax=Flavobacterium microcysteis TaxID=2596891 RepID=A0A501QFS3_9FLAO|nr:tetratricopeptide repeat-containing sensor histidine kinase [Flavobacterium microcysteis]TPD71234.1 tetratricopeptide repeat protein [Flavobacterium microcysteis]
MKRLTFFCLLLLSWNLGFAQSSELKKIQTSLPQIRDSLKYVDALNRMAILLYEKNVDSTFYYTRIAREIADRHDYKKGRADAMNNLGIFFDIKGNFQMALKYYNKGYTEYKKLKDSVNCVQSLMNIGMVYQEMGKYDRSLQRYELAFRQSKKLRNDSIRSLVIYNYLLSYPKQFSKDSTCYYIDIAKQIATKYKDERTLVAINQLVADDLISHGKRDEGLALLKETITTAIDKKLFYVSMDMLIDMGKQLETTNPEQSIAYFKQALSIAESNDYIYYSEILMRKLFEIYDARGEYATAAIFSKKLIEIHDKEAALNSESGIDYIDYALKDEQVKSLENRYSYQLTLSILACVAFILAISMIFSIRKHLQRTKEQNSQMKKALSALEHSQADNTRMMRIVAHDLRNPIGGIYSLASMMLEEPDRTEEDRAMLDLMKTSGQNSLDLVDNLLQLQFSSEQLKKEPVDIAEMLKYCVALLKSKADVKQQQLSLEIVPATVTASREKLWRVVSNLIANAIKFSPNGAKIKIKMMPKKQGVRILVKDEGIGIPAEMGEKIFDLFTEAKRPGTAGEQPFGMGLAISKQIVEAHNGKIWFENNASSGTTFYIDLPFT